MHRPINYGALVLACFLVASCGQKEVKSISYYKENPNERNLVLTNCNKDHDLFDSDSNCINAFLSDDVESIQYWKKNAKHAEEFATFCVSHSQTLGTSQSCKNAIAARSSSFGSGENPVYVTPPK
jgi:hypothetical protein